jgi:MerR family transcriptional regulator/heat shock protein HspR
VADHREEPVFAISIAAKLLGTHPQTLRMYERAGLVAPRRTSAGNRLYSMADLQRIRRIQSYTHMGVNLEGVAVIFGLCEKLEQVQRDMEGRAERIRREMDERMRKLVGEAERLLGSPLPVELLEDSDASAASLQKQKRS